MSTGLQMALLILASYLVGAVPFGFVVGKLKGIDIRKIGSGNIGATNVGRILGKRWFWVVFTLDALKGLTPMVVAGVVVAGLSEGPGKYLLWLSAGMAAMLGHLFPVYLGFKGGKGVATSLGIMLGFYPFFTITAVPAVLVFVGVFAASRIISLASIIGAGVFPVLLMAMGWMLGWDLLGAKWPVLAFAIIVCGLIIWRHRGNIERLRNGTEPRFASKSKLPASTVQ